MRDPELTAFQQRMLPVMIPICQQIKNSMDSVPAEDQDRGWLTLFTFVMIAALTQSNDYERMVRMIRETTDLALADPKNQRPT